VGEFACGVQINKYIYQTLKLKTMTNVLISIFGASYKLRLIGLLMAIFIAIQPLIAGNAIDWKQVGAAVMLAVLTFLQKGAQVTGGSVAATPEAAARITDASAPKV